MSDFDPIQWLRTMVVLIIAITIHEFAHAFVTDRCGDPTPRSQGRISLNPIDHLDPIGTVMMAISAAIGFGIGWGRPVQYIPANLKHPRMDQLKIAIWGPISNVLQAVFLAVLARTCYAHHWIEPNENADMLIRMGILINVALAIFNMIPIPPLDGSKVLSALLPLPKAQAYERIMAQAGLSFFILIMALRIPTYVIAPVTHMIFRLLLGEPINS